MPFRTLAIVFWALASQAVWATDEPVKPTENMAFERGEIGAPPPGWRGGDISTRSDGQQPLRRYARLENKTAETGSLTGVVDAAPYRGRELTLEALVRAKMTGDGGAGLWLRADGPDQRSAAFQNSAAHLVAGSEWTKVSVTIDVPPDASRLLFGGIIVGRGTADFSTLALSTRVEPTGQASNAALEYLNAALHILETRHINSAHADWPRLRSDAVAMSAHAQSDADTYPAISYVIRALGERHTFLQRPAKPVQANGDVSGSSTRPLPVVQSAGRITVLKLPYLETTQDASTAFADRYRDTLTEGIKAAKVSNTCGWIVDLRKDGGGNMWPMVNGLAAIIPQGPHPSFLKSNGTKQRWNWTETESARNNDAVALLIGPGTASSGEMTSLVFKGAPRVRTFGAPTAGLTTANEPVPLGDGAFLVVTDARVLDRSENLVSGPINPDVAADAPEQAAKDWLIEQHCPSV